jgi:hypothetical protein
MFITRKQKSYPAVQWVFAMKIQTIPCNKMFLKLKLNHCIENVVLGDMTRFCSVNK